MPSSKLLPVPTAIENVTGNRPNPVTCWRWTTKGSQGVVLESVMYGGRRMTTECAVKRFIAERTSKSSPGKVSATRSKLNSELGI